MNRYLRLLALLSWANRKVENRKNRVADALHMDYFRLKKGGQT